MSQVADPLHPTAAAGGMRRVLAIYGWVVGTLVLWGLLFMAGGWHDLGFDFHGGIWSAAQDLLHGATPYRPGRLDAIVSHVQAGAPAPRTIELPVYPPVVMLLLAPLGLLSPDAANLVFVAALIPTPAVALWLLGVRDYRCYAVTYLCVPVIFGIQIGTLSPLLMLGLAALWRWRDRALVVGGVMCALICAKLFLWPMLVWLAATRRWRAGIYSIALTAAATLGGWAAIGFADMRIYPHMLSSLSSIEQSQGYSAVAAAEALGAGAGVARAAAVALGLILLGLTWQRAGRDEVGAFTLAICASLVLSPIVWLHYLTLLMVPLALRYRTLSWPWLVPLALWLTPSQQSIDHPWGIAVAGLVVVVVVVKIVADGGGWIRTSDQPVMSGLL